MIKIIQIIILSILVSSCVTTDQIISSNKLKVDLSKSEFEDVFYNSSIFEDPLIPGSGSEFYPDNDVEIIWAKSKKLFYVFENVFEPITCGMFMCNIGNGNLSSWHEDLIPARDEISKKLNIKLGEPISGKDINTD
jgi:hypothetical protein